MLPTNPPITNGTRKYALLLKLPTYIPYSDNTNKIININR